MNLKTKSLLSVIAMTAIVAGVISYITIKNSDEVLQSNLQKEIHIDAQKIQNHIQGVKTQLKEVSKRIAQSDRVIAALNLVSKYEDKQNYNAQIFDTEKNALLDFVQRFFSQDSFFEILLYDAQGALVTKKTFNESVGNSGYVVYKDGVAYLKTDATLTKLDKDSSLNKECIGTIKTDYDNGFYKICNNKIVSSSGEDVGHVKVTYYLGAQELQALENNLIYAISFVQNPASKGLFKTAIDKDLGLFIDHDVDFSYIEKKRQELLTTIIIAIVLLSIFMFLIFLTFIKKEVLQPLHRLQDALKSMLDKRYKPIEIKNNDEIGEIFRASNEIFEQFWQSYSSLDGYKKSVETSNLVTKTDLKGKITYANELFCDISGYKQDEVIGKPHSIVRHPDMKSAIFKQMWETIKKGETWRGVIKNKTKGGWFYWADAVISPMYDADGNIKGYISIRRDITELMQSKEELEFRANYDKLTKFGSRDKLYVDLQSMDVASLVLINIDRFSQINDFYGHGFGDAFLQQFATMLQEKIEELAFEEPKLYRYGGDEFVVVFENFDKDELERAIRQTLLDLEATAIVIKDKKLNFNLSCGISFEDPQSAVLSAEMALKISKKQKIAPIVYSQENSLEKQYANNLLWAEKLKSAIEQDRVVPFFQPIVKNNTLAYEKYEALVRIVEADGKVVSPFFFLDIAKQTKQYFELTKIMVEKSFAMFRDKKELEFSINLTIEDISNLDMQKFLFAKLDDEPDVAKRLVLELVESESIEDYAQVIAFITAVKSKGCKIAIDDFGSGYSNFEYLVKLQADYIKIDGSLIKHINTQRESFVVVSTIVNFAKQMGIKTIGEFIEDEAILKTVQELGIDYSQGYHFSAPKKEI